MLASLAEVLPPPLDADEAEIQRWVAQAAAGDLDAGRKIYRAHALRVFRAVRPLCTSETEAEDVVHDTFLRALGALSRYRPRQGVRFVSWLLAIAINCALRLKRRRSAPHSPADVTRLREAEVIGSEDPGDAIDRERQKAVLLAALAELPDRDREIVTLRYGAELSAAEVAATTGLSEANVRKICERRRKALLERIAELEGKR